MNTHLPLYLALLLCGCPLIQKDLADLKTADTADTSLPDTGTLPESDCDDELDNDEDGLTDCDDSDCRSSLTVNVRPTDDVAVSSDLDENINGYGLWVGSVGTNLQESWLKFDATESVPSTGRLEEVQICLDRIDSREVLGGESIEVTAYQLAGDACSTWTQTDDALRTHPCERGQELGTFIWHGTITSARCFALTDVDFEHTRDEGILLAEKNQSTTRVIFVDQEASDAYPALAVIYSECTALP